MLDSHAREIRTLRWRASGVVALLCAVTLGGLLVLWRWFAGRDAASDSGLLSICMASGMLGGTLSALLSAANRIGNGWEVADGTKYPAAGRPDKFVARMIPLFLFRPVFGAATGFLVCCGIVGGYLVAVRSGDDRAFSPHGLAFFSVLGGLFAKTLLDKLKTMFKALLGAEGRPGPASGAESPPASTALDDDSGPF